MAALERAEALLIRDVPAPSAQAIERMWRNVRQPRRRRRHWIAVPALAAIIIVLLFLLVWRTDSRPTPSQRITLTTPERLPPATTLVFGRTVERRTSHGVLVIFEGTQLALESEELLILDRGEVHLSIEPGAPFAVVTDLGRVEMFGGVVQMAATSDGTSVDVHAGRVRLTSRDGIFDLGAGERSSLLPPPEPPVHEDDPKPRRPGRPHPDPVPPDVTPSSLEVRDLETGAATTSPTAEDVDIEELSRRADEARRRGELEEAASLYARIAGHAGGTGYAEEALLRRARILHLLGRRADARSALIDAGARFPEGPLAPERGALSARLLLESGDLDGAVRLLESLARSRGTVELQTLRVEVAEALVNRDPARARSLYEAALFAPMTNSETRRAAHRGLDRLEVP